MNTKVLGGAKSQLYQLYQPYQYTHPGNPYRVPGAIINSRHPNRHEDRDGCRVIGDRYPGHTPPHSPKARAVAQRHNLPPKRWESSRGSIKGGRYADITAGAMGRPYTAPDPRGECSVSSATTLRSQTTITGSTAQNGDTHNREGNRPPQSRMK